MNRSSTSLTYLKHGALALAMLAGAAAPRPAQAHDKPNACGCYQNTAGMCFCERTSKCGCPDECEPKGCAEKRQQELDQELEVEMQKAIEAERQQREEAEERERAANPFDEDEADEAESSPVASLCE